jgi:tRNA(fMet)-specific endonuclease VapC
VRQSLIDTDIFSEILRGRDQTVCNKAEAYLAVFDRFTISVITITELVEGFHRQGRDDRIDVLLSGLETEKHECINLDFEAAVIAGRIFGDLYRIGQPIGNADPFIAAIAIQKGIPLVSGNTKHFERIQSLDYPLQLEDWRQATS